MNQSPHTTNGGAERAVLQNLRSLDVASVELERYGVHPDQFIEWFGPAEGKVVVLIHGGFFDDGGSVEYLRPAAYALGEAGYRAALVEYRWQEGSPELSFADIYTLSRMPEFTDAIWLGHSVGSILVLRALFSADLDITNAVVVAPIFDLRRHVEEFPQPAKSKITKWLGGLPEIIPDVYAKYDPAVAYASLGADEFTNRGYKLKMLHGIDDQTIPVQRTRDLTGNPFDIALVPAANHNDVVRPGHDAWILLLGALG